MVWPTSSKLSFRQLYIFLRAIHHVHGSLCLLVERYHRLYLKKGWRDTWQHLPIHLLLRVVVRRSPCRERCHALRLANEMEPLLFNFLLVAKRKNNNRILASSLIFWKLLLNFSDLFDLHFRNELPAPFNEARLFCSGSAFSKIVLQNCLKLAFLQLFYIEHEIKQH